MADPFRLFGQTFVPSDLKTLTRAFDEAWAQIEDKYTNGNEAVAKDRLAKAIVRLAQVYGLDAAVIARDAAKVVEREMEVCGRWIDPNR